mgnify:FL=1
MGDQVPSFIGRRFLIVIGTFSNLGGAERQALLLGEFLTKEIGAEVTFLASFGGELLERELDRLGIAHVVAPFGEHAPPARKCLNFLRLIPVIRRLHPEFIIPFISYNSKVVGLLWKFTGAKYALWNQRDEGRGLYGSRLERIALRNVCDIVSNSYSGRDALVQKCGVAADAVTIINNGVVIPHTEDDTAPQWRQKLGVRRDALLVSMIANLSVHKDHATLLRAWKEVEEQMSASNREAALVLAGAPMHTEQELKALAFDLHLHTVFMPGHVANVKKLLSECDLVVHSSKREGCPNGVLEAMALGKAVVGTDIPGMRQALGDRFAGDCLVPAADAERLAARICALLQEETLRTDIGAANRQRICREFSVKKMGYSFLSLVGRHEEDRAQTERFHILPERIQQRLRHIRSALRQDHAETNAQRQLRSRGTAYMRESRQNHTVLTGATWGDTGGVRNHLLAIRDHSRFTVGLLPPDELLPFVARQQYRRVFQEMLDDRFLREQPLVHSHVCPWLVSACARERAGRKPWVHTYHTLYFPEHWQNGLKEWQKEINHAALEIAPQADVRISVAKWLQKHLQEAHGIEALYIPNGVDVVKCEQADPERFIQDTGLNQHVLFAGSLRDIKNPSDFVRLAQKMPDRQFVMIGQDISAANIKQRLGLEVPRNLTALGQMPHERVLDAIAASSCFVLTSRNEGLPTAVMEAMALQRPCVVPDLDGSQEVVDFGKAGYVYRHDSLDDLVAKTEAALQDRNIGARARQRVVQEYDWCRVIRRLDAVYEELRG